MGVIVELTLPSEAFELGRILEIEGATEITMETMVPLGGKATPFSVSGTVHGLHLSNVSGIILPSSICMK